MPVLLSPEIQFPEILPSTDDVIAIGGDLSEERLLLAYREGIFPWFNEDEPILWWSPDPRCIIYPEDLKVSKSMRPYLNQSKYRVSYDTAFEDVIQCCALPRKGQDGTWITEDIIGAYCALHRRGLAHSVEVWDGDNLAGGLYGVSLGKCFFGESMFCKANNASKLAFITLMQELSRRDFQFIDCQIFNDHLGSLGAIEIPRKRFLKELNVALQGETLQGDWGEIFD